MKTNLNPEIIERIAACSLALQSKASLLLCYAGISPCCEIVLLSEPWEPGDTMTQIDNDEIVAICLLLQQAGLIEVSSVQPKGYHIDYPVHANCMRASWLVANNFASAGTLRKNSIKYNLEEKGLLFGHPATAAKAAARGDIIDLDTTAPLELLRVLSGHIGCYVPWEFSEEHWFDELSELVRRHNFIADLSPDLYLEIIAAPNRYTEKADHATELAMMS